MNYVRHLAFGLLALIASSAQAWGQMNYSTYEDVWYGEPQVVGYAELDDITGGCITGGFSQTTTLYSPTRSAASSGSQASLSYDAEVGQWNVVAGYGMQCQCGPPGGHTFTMSAGRGFFASTQIAFYQYYQTQAVGKLYTRCNTGACYYMLLFGLTGTPPFVSVSMLLFQPPGIPPTCWQVGTPITVASCAG